MLKSEDANLPEDLTQKQLATLQLLARGLTSKEISRMLGISPYTVDQRLNLLKRKAGVSSRRELGELFRAQSGIYQTSIYKSSGIDDAPADTPSGGVDTGEDSPRPAQPSPTQPDRNAHAGGRFGLVDEARRFQAELSAKTFRWFLMLVLIGTLMTYFGYQVMATIRSIIGH